MVKFAAAAAALIGLVSAVPANQKYYSLNQLARFENSDSLPLVAASPIGIYLDILWNGMTLVSTLTDDVPGIVPNTPNNYAAYSALSAVTLLEGQPAMQVNYADSTIDHFDLKSFYYGCAVASRASIVGVPASCKITIRGYSDFNGDKEVASQTFSFDVDPLDLQENMRKATVSSKFKGVRKVEFDVSNDALTAALIDTVDYTVYSTGKIVN